jgi:hypothetical protein
MSAYTEDLTMFDRINLAACAQRRATDNLFDSNRWNGEYDTARLWMKYRLIKTTTYSYIDEDS